MRATVNADHESRPPAAGRQLWLIAEQAEQRRQLIAEVAVRAHVWRPRAYGVPEALRERIAPGATVRVPLGKRGRIVDGVCVRITEGRWDQTNPAILEVCEQTPRLSEHLTQLGMWISDYYVCPAGVALAAMMPAAARRPALRRVVYLRATGQSDERPLTERQRALVEVLSPEPRRRDEALRAAGASAATLRALTQRGLIVQDVRREPVDLVGSFESAEAKRLRAADTSATAAEPPEAADSFELTAGQAAALEAIDAAQRAAAFKVFLMFGVPGSGKTEVYVRAMRRAIAEGRQAILLVPEIALATQVIDRLARRFERVAVLHSRLSESLRRATLAAIGAGRVDVVIGTRSAVLAPCPRLGLIVVDEEQEGSFKSLSAPRFHARDVAIKRAQLERCPVVLGSATPSLESWYNARVANRYGLLTLPERVPGAELPQVRLAAMPQGEAAAPRALLSVTLLDHLRTCLAAGWQAVLLHNRRGYAALLRCTRCGLLVRCERCGASVVYHRVDDAVRCHRCGRRRSVPTECLDDTCRGPLQRAGLAIQRLEEELQRTVPGARLLRLDSDTMRRHADYRAALERFERGEADILLGTQMVAKGLDFPGVRLVGVIDADATLWMPDFRAAEHAFQLIVQVVGRAGRRLGESLAIVQCQDVQNRVVRSALSLDYEAFATAELEIRRELDLPPYSRLVRLVCADARPGQARSEAEALAAALREAAGRIDAALQVDEATPCAVARVRELYRHQVLIRGPRDGSGQRLLSEARSRKALSPRVRRFVVDVDPIEMR
jgi:primosomal protein N' (replication factor Y)